MRRLCQSRFYGQDDSVSRYCKDIYVVRLGIAVTHYPAIIVQILNDSPPGFLRGCRMEPKLPPWVERLAELLPARAGIRPRDGSVFLRMQRATLRARPAMRSEFALRAFAPAYFGASVGVIPDGDSAFLIEAPAHGRRLDRAGSEARYQQLTMLVWALHCAGHTPEDIELQRLLATESGLKLLTPPGRGDEGRAAMALAWARAFVTGRKATAGLRADRLAPLVLRVLGGESAAP